MKWHRVMAMLLRYWYITTNSMPRIFDIFYWPLMGVIVFGFTTLYIQKASGFNEIFVFLLGGLILWTFMERIQKDVAVYVLEDFWSRNVSNTFSTPIRKSEMFVSLTIFSLVRGIISFIIMFFAAILFYKFNVLNGNISVALFTIPLIITAWSLGILVTGLIFRFGMRISIFAWSTSYLLQPFAGVYYPISTLPLIMQKIALFTPLMYIFEGFRNSYSGAFDLHNFWMGNLVAIIFLALGYLVFFFSLNAAKKKGLLAKY